ncbi:unnamed protein product [Prorocentrum cordatum]|uniref:MYND-type domain-containing protein n=1 Tax=Prorocentrum cordatum TaxID=2364126 RepID=A0ABN9W9M9_9DINO|nr:unnamed protein product [Polarella glacialis]
MAPAPEEAALAAPGAAVEALLGGLAAGAGGEVESKAFKDCRYLFCKAAGLSLRLRPAASGHVDVVYLYAEGVDGFSAYRAGPLPAGLDWSDTSRSVVTRLGEPSDRFGGNRMPVQISYEVQGLDVHFRHCSWDDAENPVASLAVFAPTDPCFDLCAVCGKKARFHCSRCRLRRYCSSSCQRADWPKHQVACGHAGGGALGAAAKRALGGPLGGPGQALAPEAACDAPGAAAPDPFGAVRAAARSRPAGGAGGPGRPAGAEEAHGAPGAVSLDALD